MRTITIRPLQPFGISVEAESISPDKFEPLTLAQIRKLVIWQGNRQRTLSDLFGVEGEEGEEGAKPAAEITIRLEGDFSRVKRIAEGMSSGTVEVAGSVGMHAGNNMKGGLLRIEGNADDWLGREMRGGKIEVKGNAGNYAGAGYRGEKCGMRGGEIEIGGNAGSYLGEHMCGGSIRMNGDAGDFPGAANQGGTIFIAGSTYLPGAEMTKGTITVQGKARILPGYQRIQQVSADGVDYQKYIGDLVENGKGELIVAEGSS
ncbi:MAG: formylmethanofuran dehydrogenase subunit C [Methanothrix sp.]|nr:formylmethanofuran dehydrogenase subunit C [Methanothrix sp.]